MRNKFRNTDSVIKAGELILTEQPFAFVLSSKEKGFRCDNCLEKGKVLKCSGCQFVHYCGRACQRDAWNDHKDLSDVRDLGIDECGCWDNLLLKCNVSPSSTNEDEKGYSFMEIIKLVSVSIIMLFILHDILA